MDSRLGHVTCLSWWVVSKHDTSRSSLWKPWIIMKKFDYLAGEFMWRDALEAMRWERERERSQPSVVLAAGTRHVRQTLLVPPFPSQGAQANAPGAEPTPLCPTGIEKSWPIKVAFLLSHQICYTAIYNWKMLPFHPDLDRQMTQNEISAFPDVAKSNSGILTSSS